MRPKNAPQAERRFKEFCDLAVSWAKRGEFDQAPDVKDEILRNKGMDPRLMLLKFAYGLIPGAENAPAIKLAAAIKLTDINFAPAAKEIGFQDNRIQISIASFSKAEPQQITANAQLERLPETPSD